MSNDKTLAWAQAADSYSDDSSSSESVLEEPPTDPDGDGGDSDDGEWEPEGDFVELDPPRMNVRSWRQLWKTRRWLKKREKLIGDGYIQWYLVGDAVNRPKFINPERNGGGIPEKEINGETYLFPRNALVPSADGMWTCIHREGEADPINIRDPERLSIPADELKEYLDLRVSSSAPGFFDNFETGDILKIAIAGIIGIALFQQFAGGF